MWPVELDAEWQQVSEQVLAEVKAWRAAHPAATMREIEQELDARLAGGRARLLEATAQASPASAPAASGPRPDCPACGTPMHLEGERLRRLLTTQHREVVLRRAYARCPRCGTGLFPPG